MPCFARHVSSDGNNGKVILVTSDTILNALHAFANLILISYTEGIIIIVLSCYRLGICGTNWLNEFVQDHLASK